MAELGSDALAAATLDLDQFRRDGYAIIGALEPSTIANLRSAVELVTASRSFDGQGLHLLGAIGHHDAFIDLLAWEPLLEAATHLLSSNIYVHHSHLDVHPPSAGDWKLRWHRDGGVQGRDMQLMPRDQPRLAIKAGVFLSSVRDPDDGALELVPGSHRDSQLRPPDLLCADAKAMCCPEGTVVVFDTRIWHRRRDNLRSAVRRALFFTYTYRWIAPRDDHLGAIPTVSGLSPLIRQLLGARTWDAFYPRPGELPLDAWLTCRR